MQNKIRNVTFVNFSMFSFSETERKYWRRNIKFNDQTENSEPKAEQRKAVYYGD